MRKELPLMYETVRNILRQFPEARDNDRILELKVWAEEFPGLRNAENSIYEFTSRYISGKFASPETISRSRRKCQEQHPELRGYNYYNRQREEGEVRSMINDPELFP